MSNSPTSSRRVSRRVATLISAATVFGALIVFAYFALIDPIPVDEAAVSPLETEGIVVFAVAGVVILVAAIAMVVWLGRPIRRWLRLIEAGTPASEMPPNVARLVLIWPLVGASLVAAGSLVVAIFLSILYDDPGNFVGIAIGGAVGTTIVYFGTDLIWREQIPTFFPDGDLSSIHAFRLSVRRRLLLAFALIGGLTPTLLVVLTQARTRAMLDAENPRAILDNLVVVQLYILGVGLLAGVITAVLVARAIVGPLEALQAAMGRVENSELDTRVAVTTNDELGYLGERFNVMTDGLRQGERLRELFGLYVSAEVAQAAVESGAGLGGTLVDCTVVFSDIRDFTTLSEQMPPARLVDVINRYMTAMVSVIVDHGGVVTRFGGDSVLAVFGTPLNPMADHADRAVRTAIGMRRALAAFNDEETLDRLPNLRSGIGIATGPVIAGNIGGRERIEYTVMGDAVNLAARLEEKTKEAGAPILMSAETYQALDGADAPHARALTDLEIKGKRSPVTAYALAEP
ncbi:adenylate/guanylate cyclase domain-containing protein [Agromyces bracchium]|uniref:HAMP domain-containing protein n=1 Tax=Agromyces bracchium TaxID=88376 RepID=A0A6I3MH83_9MICO|nr:adenylate/guanylate cyclase domain-containing protein [Agromyces bracchium]MTH69663.1 HAMP domain-containing protein [Agromyces bracchium]